MSTEEESELKELVVQALESNGVLAQIRAQLRASVFLALEEANSVKLSKPLVNMKLKEYLSTKKGKITAHLIQDFLKHFNMKSTLSVFESETSFGQMCDNESKSSVCQYLGVTTSEQSDGLLLDAVINKVLQKQKAQETENVPSPLLYEPLKSNSLPPLGKNLSHTVDRGQLEAENVERDPFFDDPLSNDVDIFYIKRSAVPPSTFETKSTANIIPTNSNVSKSSKDPPGTSPASLHKVDSAVDDNSLMDLSAHIGDSSQRSTKSSLKSNKTLNDSGDEDINSSASFQSDCKSESTHSVEEEENLSEIVDELLLTGEHTDDENVTTDHTVSRLGDGADYVEDVVENR